jgi:predicted RNase H-like HicB family nuclease
VIVTSELATLGAVAELVRVMAMHASVAIGQRFPHSCGRMCASQEIGMRYTVVLEQEEDGGYVTSVPALPGCVSQGDDRAQALINIREAIELYVEDCRDAGDPVPTEAGKEFVEVEAA